MKYFCVSYDLEYATSDEYKNIDTILEEIYNGVRVLETVWVLKLENHYTCFTLKQELFTFFKEGDQAFISQIGTDYEVI